MKIKLTLQEKLRDLREERKLTLAEVAERTGIPLSTLGHLEKDEDMRVGYQDVAVLARFYNVSADYLFGLTDNRLHRNVAIDDISLSDGAIDVLKNKKANNRLISELLAHSDFPYLISAMEVYIDGKISAQTGNMNAVFKFAEQTLRENVNAQDNDEIMAFLREAVIDENEYLRYRIAERFNNIMKSLFDAHKKDSLSDGQSSIVEEMKSDIQEYLKNRKTEAKGKAQMILWAKKLGLNISKLTDEEQRVFMRVLEDSEVFRKNARRKKQ